MSPEPSLIHNRVANEPRAILRFVPHLYSMRGSGLVWSIRVKRKKESSTKLLATRLGLERLIGAVGDTFDRLSLTTLRGNYVLLDFWATWCAPCVAKLDEVDEVERLRKQHAGKDKLTVVGVNLDDDKERARAFLKSRSLPWQHTLLGDWSATDVPRRFAIANVPAYALIGPDGRIMAHESSLEAIEKKLAGLAAGASRK